MALSVSSLIKRAARGNEGMYVIAGLGNPGRSYEKTRHNMGFQVIDRIAEKHGISVKRLKHQALIGDGRIAGQKVLLVKPQTYMNNSGQSLGQIIRYYDVEPDHLIVIYDDIDIQRGKIRVRSSGSAGTHNGMKSVIYCVESQDFARVRIGCGPVPEHWDLADFVLSSIPKEEQETMLKAFEEGAKAVEDILSGKPIPGGRNRGGSHHS